HCLQGISRSGAVIVAYLMRKLEIDYPTALVLVRKYRDVVNPKEGFEKKLQHW
ncbi:hypothetical protein K469DRAFT_478194, partial [Zopfia rhizophila CBS 207.26]